MRHLEGPLEDDRQVLRVDDLGGPLGEDLARAHDVAAQMRVALQEPGVVLAGGDHQRDSPGQSVVEHRGGGGQTGAGVQVEKAGSAGGPGVALGHAGAHHLMQTQDVI